MSGTMQSSPQKSTSNYKMGRKDIILDHSVCAKITVQSNAAKIY